MPSRIDFLSCCIILSILFHPSHGVSAHILSNEGRATVGHQSRVLVLLIDGLRWDLLSSKHSNHSFPGFDKLKSLGGYVEQISPVFPAECYPNIYSIFTGRYPAKHGVRFTTMFDEAANETHSFDNFDGQLPDRTKKLLKSGDIWDRWHKHNRTMHLYNFPICPSNLPTGGAGHCEAYMAGMSPVGLNRTVQRALTALRNGSVNAAVVYYDRLDRAGHECGPFSTESYSAFLALDAIIFSLMGQLETLALTDPNPVHLVATSDHGMSEVSTVEHIDRILSPLHLKKVINRGSTVAIWSQPEHRSIVLRRLQLHNGKFFHIYNRSTIPSRWNTDGTMFPEILVVLKPGVLASSVHWPIQLNHCKQLTGTDMKGAHGYDAKADEMHIPLFAYGPTIRPGSRYNGARRLDHVHTHFLIAQLSDIPHLEDDGDQMMMYDLFRPLLSPSLPEPISTFSLIQGRRTTSIITIVLVLSAAFMCLLISLQLLCRSGAHCGHCWLIRSRSQTGLTDKVIIDESVRATADNCRLLYRT